MIPVRENELDPKNRLAVVIKQADETKKEAERTRHVLDAWEGKQAQVNAVLRRGPVSVAAVDEYALAKLTAPEINAQVEKVRRELVKTEAAASHLASEVERAWAELAEAGDKIKALSAAVDAVVQTGDNLAVHRVKSQLATAQGKVDRWLAIVG